MWSKDEREWICGSIYFFFWCWNISMKICYKILKKIGGIFLYKRNIEKYLQFFSGFYNIFSLRYFNIKKKVYWLTDPLTLIPNVKISKWLTTFTPPSNYNFLTHIQNHSLALPVATVVDLVMVEVQVQVVEKEKWMEAVVPVQAIKSHPRERVHMMARIHHQMEVKRRARVQQEGHMVMQMVGGFFFHSLIILNLEKQIISSRLIQNIGPTIVILTPFVHFLFMTRIC